MSTMSLRLLFGMLASALPDQYNHTETTEVPEKESLATEFQLVDYAGAARLHIGMLTISLLVGLAYGGYVSYTCWTEKEIFLGYIRNLVIALVCRTLFTIIFDGVVMLGSPTNVRGGNAMSALEQIFINLVLGFWLSLTVYAHARVQRNFKSEPTLRLYQYGIPAVAAFFAFVWIFSMQHACPNGLWWGILSPFSPWIVHSANLLFLLIQLALVADMCRMMMPVKSSLDNDSVSLLWKVAAMMAALIFIFWLQFGLSLGYYKIKQSYLYFFFFIDGIEGTLVCVIFYFFYRWVTPLRKNSLLTVESGEAEITAAEERETEVLPPGGRGIVTVDSICITTESGRWKTPEDESSKDVVYSNVVEPHRLQKTLELYKRFNVIPNQVTVVEGDQFYDCHMPLEPERVSQKASPALVTRKMTEPTQKKNAFYASKYLILDSKEGEIPKYLETRPSVSESLKEEQRNSFSDFEKGERVRKWLNDNSENMSKDRKSESQIGDEELSRKDSDLKISEPSIEKAEENLSVEKVDNNRVELGKQSVPKLVPELHVDLSTENDAAVPRTETPADMRDDNNDTPSESVRIESLSIASFYFTKPELPIINEPEAKDEPTEPIKPYLTYSELLELRSKREKSDEPPASTTESIFSRVINASSHFLASLKGLAQADKDSTTVERQPQTEDKQEVQTGEKPKELPREEAKPSDLTVPSLPVKPTEEQVEDAGTRPETIKERELTLEHKMKNDEIEIRGMQNLEEQCFIADREQVPEELTEDEVSSLETSLGSNSARQELMEYRKESPEPPSAARQSSDISKVQPPNKLTEDKEKPVEGFWSLNLEQQSLNLNKAHQLTEDKEKPLEQIERQALDNSKVQPPKKLKKDKEKPVEGFRGSNLEQQSLNLNKAHQLTEDKEKPLEQIERQALDISKVQPTNKLTEDKEKPVEGFWSLNLEQQSLNLKKAQSPQKLIEDEEELVETSSESEFSIEKRHSYSSVQRRPTINNEKPTERFSYLGRQNPLTQDEEVASSDSEFSIEKGQSFTKSKPIQNKPPSRTVYPITSQSQATAASDSKVTLERNPSSSSSEPFSLQEYYAKVLKDRSKFRN